MDKSANGFILFSQDGQKVTLDAIMLRDLDIEDLSWECPKCAGTEVQILQFPKKRHIS